VKFDFNKYIVGFGTPEIIVGAVELTALLVALVNELAPAVAVTAKE